MKIFVVGSGKLANAILTSDLTFQTGEILKWEMHYQTLTEKAIIIHAGSGRQLEACLQLCSKTKSTLIELSTGSEMENKKYNFPFIVCPNTSFLVLKTLKMLKAYGGSFENYEISITESHQLTKRTEPGTAFAFADSLKVPRDKIVSVRDIHIQQDIIGIPKEYTDTHAFHKIVIKDGSDQVTIETRVMGHDSYIKGVKKIIDTVLKHKLDNRKYTVLDLIDYNML